MKEQLFRRTSATDYVRNIDGDLASKIAAMPGQAVNKPDIVDEMVELYTIKPLEIHIDQLRIEDAGEAQVDTGVIDGHTRMPKFFPGTFVVFAVPYSGHSTLLRCTPSKHGMWFPEAEIRDRELFFRYQTTAHETENVRSQLDSSVGVIQTYASQVNADIEPFNQGLRNRVVLLIEARRKKLKADSSFIESFGIPMKSRANAPISYTVPAIRKPVITLPKPNAASPTPMLESHMYEEILSSLTNMSLAMEKSPGTFSKLKEEEIRDFFLIVLNSQYEISATGETFNANGKTDILMSYKGKNVFIAECKFWKGEKVLEKAIDQILSYTSWRDSKTALLIFNKQKKMTEVIEKVKHLVPAHEHYLRMHKLAASSLNIETIQGYVFKHPSDSAKELLLTVMMFDVPLEGELSGVK